MSDTVTGLQAPTVPQGAKGPSNETAAAAASKPVQAETAGNAGGATSSSAAPTAGGATEPNAVPLGQVRTVELSLLDLEEGWNVEEARSTLLEAASQAQQVAKVPVVESRRRPPPIPPSTPRSGDRPSFPPRMRPPLQVPSVIPPKPDAVRSDAPSVPPPLPSREGREVRESASSTPSTSTVSAPAAAERARAETPIEQLTSLLEVRVAAFRARTSGGDKLAHARAHLELAVLDETAGDGTKVLEHAESALKIEPSLLMAHSLVRRARHGRGAARELIEPLEFEIVASATDGERADLLAEKARLLEAAGGREIAVREAWEAALTVSPNHPAALKGLEGALTTAHGEREGTKVAERLAAHLGRMADAYEEEPKLAAWLHVERARILDRRLHDPKAAWGALKQALALDSGVGPVRSACVRHAARHNDVSALFELLVEEAQVETEPARLARLELDAATLAATRLGDLDRAVALLERAHTRAPTAETVDRRVLDLLVMLHEAAGRLHDAIRVRRARASYIEEPRRLAYELRVMAALAERAGDLVSALASVERAMALDPKDPTLLETMDRLFASVAREDRRAQLWADVAARTEEPRKRARLLMRAAKISEGMGRPAEAVIHLRAALSAAPADAEVVEALARLLTPQPAEASEARARIAIYMHAAEEVTDPVRKVGYLERAALLWEESLGDAVLATRAYQQVLEIDPDRRSAIVGLQRTAARVGDARALGRALLDEARVLGDAAHRNEALDLMTRAAAAFAFEDSERALSLVVDVLEKNPAHEEARALEVRLHEVAGRWEKAVEALTARIEATKDDESKIYLWLARADIVQTRLGRIPEAIASLRAVHALDPAHPVPPDTIPRLLESLGEWSGLRDELVSLANKADTPFERVRHLLRAAEIDEYSLREDEKAAALYTRALGEAPSHPLLLERLVRLAARLGPDRADPTGKLEGGGSQGAFERAMLFVEAGADPQRAIPPLETVTARQTTHLPALRTLETLARTTQALPLLANALAQQATTLHAPVARLGALWSMAQLVEWRLPESGDTSAYARILELAPEDRNALEAVYRRTVPLARAGDGVARAAATSALLVLLALKSGIAKGNDDTSRLMMHLTLAHLYVPLNEANGAANAHLAADIPSVAARSALDHHRKALAMDRLSVTAALGTARFASQLRDGEAGIAAATSLADLAQDPKVAARHLLEAADLLLSAPEDTRLGSSDQRRTRAVELLERALDADPESIPVAGRLATVRADQHRPDRLVEVFRSAIRRANAPDAIVMLGGEIARLARTELKDLTVAVDAMRRVREVAPRHIPSLLTLAELYIAQRAWPEAVDALEAVVQHAHGPGVGRDGVSTVSAGDPRLTALFALASLYERVLSKPEQVDRVLRLALDIEPTSARALRGLIRRLGSSPEANDRAVREEVASLLERLAMVETAPDQKGAIFLDLCGVRATLEDRAGAERALCEAIAWIPSLLDRLLAFHTTPQGLDRKPYGAALRAISKRQQEIGRPDPLVLATLGQLELDAAHLVAPGQPSSQLEEAIAHLRAALSLSPGMHETRLLLAAALSRAGRHDEASKSVVDLLIPDSRPFLSLRAPASALELLERAFAADRRTEEALVARELRALAGTLDDASQLWLRGRRLSFDSASTEPFDRAALIGQVLPPEGRHVLLDVSFALSGCEGKLFRSTAHELGVSSRDRVSPRSGHPLRPVFDRLAWLLRIPETELYVSEAVSYTRVVSQDVPWVVFPQSQLEQPESRQLASLGRALTRIALGVPWIEDLPPPHVQALLTAAARHANPSYSYDVRDRHLADLIAEYEPRVSRALGRKQRKLLSDLAFRLDAPSNPSAQEMEAFVRAIARAELRVAFLVTGDLLATFDELRTLDVHFARSIGAVNEHSVASIFSHPLAGDLARFALSKEATALRWRMGSTWGGASNGAPGR
ncbi:tetratricopeptide repeat protein [Pendulispora albinea]|uniref:Tetratricopeptide repeat protein n=1 Tax=Pendulispora albinea TaxID=2741071 RepID=A0ABZ2M3W7_9BACT